MQFGYILPNLLSPVANAAALRTTAQLVDSLGFDSIWATDHILMPVEHPQYGNGTEAITTLAYLAPLAPHVTLGLSVLVLPMRNPIIAAKQIASLEHLAGRQVIVGVGVGWNETEYGYLNADFHKRGKLLDEYISIFRTLWSQEHPTHQGTYNFSGATFSPRPKTLPPIWIGGETDAAIERAIAVGDGYHPNYRANVNYGDVVKRIREKSDRPITMSMRITFDIRKEGTASVLAKLKSLQAQRLEYPAIGFRHETLSDLVNSIELFAHEVMPALKSNL